MPSSIAELSDREVDQFIIRARRGLAQHVAEIMSGPSIDAGDHRAAISTILRTLRELVDLHPTKRAKIGALIARYRGWSN